MSKIVDWLRAFWTKSNGSPGEGPAATREHIKAPFIVLFT